MQKQVQYIIKGMNKDMTVSKFPADHSFENKNIRITQSKDQTLLSVTNEKGPKEVVLTWDEDYAYEVSGDWVVKSGECNITGKIVGHCAIRNYIVLFVSKNVSMTPLYITKENSIYRIEPDTGKTVCLLSSRDRERRLAQTKEIFLDGLFFGSSIQAIGIYENDSIIKVYWVDERNQNRFINIVNPLKLEETVVNDEKYYKVKFTPNDVNFVPYQDFNEEVTINRVDSSNGVFAPGAIQYALTYYNLYGQETAIFYQSDLYYTSFSDRGGSEEETVSNAFKIKVKYPDTVPNFDYIRIYSILRTSVNAVPQCNLVADLNLRELDVNDYVEFVDTGTTGESYDYNALLYMGGELFSSRTMAAKDLTLFNGNLNLLIPNIPNELKECIRQEYADSHITISFTADKPYDIGIMSGTYPYNIHLDKAQSEITTFKYRETYRFGIQFLHKSGKWSDVVFIADKENDTTSVGTSMANLANVSLVQAKITFALSSAFDEYSTWLSDNGFIKMRPVVVYPELWDRSILAQGIVCPTVYNVEDRNSNRPFAYSSWYSRPNAGSNSLTNTLGSHGGAYNEFRHNEQIPNQKSINAEIQCITETGQHPNNASYSPDVTQWVQDHKENFFIDKSIITFHSPELELTDDLDVIDLSNVKFRIVGIVPMTSFDSDIYLSTSTVGNPTHNTEFTAKDSGKESNGTSIFGPGFYDEKIKVDNYSSANGWRCRMGNINWIDEETHYKEDHADDGHNYKKAPKWYGFFIYPWHRSKSLNNTVSPDENGWESALLQNKIITNSRYSMNSFFFTNPWTAGISGVKLANIEPQSEESEVSLVKLPQPENSDLGELNYYGSVDKIVVMSNGGDKAIGYPIIIADSSRLTGSTSGSNVNYEGSSSPGPRAMTNHELFTGSYDAEFINGGGTPPTSGHPAGGLFEYLPYGFADVAGHDSATWHTYINSSTRRIYWQVSTFDPIRIRYKSTKHAVMAFNYTNARKQVILPRLSSDTALEEEPNFGSKKYFWEVGKSNYAVGTSQDVIDAGNYGIGSSSFGYLFLGELYRDDVNNRFGGITEEALEKNTWIPAGEICDIPDSTGTENVTVDRGDTYYQRYDCLKTYPFTPDEKNSLIETVSFMCETRVNCDGRYDKNRGNATKFTITPKNFNLMNPVYNQRNNFFNYQYLNKNRVYPNHFNQVTWSMTKTLGEEIDTWAKMNLGSLLDMDGEYGEITALVFFGNEVWCFQEKGISKILFNNRVQIPVSDGVPIEITNGMKVQGKLYVTTKAGLQNKFAITITPNGVYFVDGYSHTITIFNGQSIQNISDIKGFREWMYTQDGVTPWVSNWLDDSIKVFYDGTSQDVYFVTKNTCLVFSELLAEFTSFYDYQETPVMETVNDKFFAMTCFNNSIRNWRMFDGDYNVFYKPLSESNWEDYYKPFYVTYNVNPDPTLDKTFDNVEFRADSWVFPDFNNDFNDDFSVGLTGETFDTLEVWNEYQHGTLPLIFTHAKYSGDSTLKRKFRVWRTIMPRESGTRNRIRNTWCKVKLSWQTPNRFKTILHDTIIKYFV